MAENQKDETLEAGSVTSEGPTPAVVVGVKSSTKGTQCPGCGSTGPFKVAVSGQISVEVQNHGTRGADVRFDGGSDCACESCGEKGVVRHFRADTPGMYTAVLLYPDYATGDHGADIFVECAESVVPWGAAKQVQQKASEQNDDIPADDFRVIAVFAGDLRTGLDATYFVPDGEIV